MGALLFTIAWVAMVLLGVFVLLIGIASVRNGDGELCVMDSCWTSCICSYCCY